MTHDTQASYRVPPAPLDEILDAPPTPAVSMCPNKVWLAFMDLPSHPPIEELAEPEVCLAGIRINPDTNDHSRQGHITGMMLKRLSGGPELQVSGLPRGPVRMRRMRWSPDGAHLAFSIVTPRGGELWVMSVPDMKARRLTEARLSAVIGTPYRWSVHSDSLLCNLVPEGRGEPPQAPQVPPGPIIEENIDRKAPVRTYQDLLSSPHDEALFEYHAESQLAFVDLEGEVTPIGTPALYTRATQSPDGRHLIVAWLHRPFSYLVPLGRFPRKVQVWDRAGQLINDFTDLPLAEEIPIGFSAARAGPRQIEWRADKPATLKWVEAQDGGDPELEVEIRDKLYTHAAPFEGPVECLMGTGHRLTGVIWCHGGLAMVTEAWWKTRHMKMWVIAPDRPEVAPELFFDRSWEDSYNDPGRPMLRENEAGYLILRTTPDGKGIYLVGEGASSEGNKPFLDRLDLETKRSERLWQSEPPSYEQPIEIMDEAGGLLLTRREAIETPPNFFIRDIEAGTLQALTDFPHPTPQLLGIKKELIRYEREDGVQLTGTLFLPRGYEPERDGPLPSLLWAYPQEFKSASAAGQVRDSPHRFVRVGWWSPVLWVTRGFAVLSDPTMPIVGEGESEPNDSYVAQLVSGARAAIETLSERGVTDPARVAVGGHSYGAFMTANLLAHSDLFSAGIARSGAFNRTLTPFGFQSEERTLWQAPKAYFDMSPFMHADKIEAPLLLIHGSEDNNSGTYPMQSERFYNALKGHGATCRLVMLPHESHAYRARESIMHTVWETDAWLMTHTVGQDDER